MLKVLIVDDDSVARTNIKTLIDWTKNGFEICSEAVNGSNAIQAINTCVPDIVITDMSMPVMDGVALIQYLEHNYPGIKTIALSGYNDFDYVRQSMKNGALDYILKHMLSPEALLNVLNSARDAILYERQESDQKQKLQEQLSESREIMKQNFIRQLVYGGVSEIEDIRKNIESLGLELDIRNLGIVASEIDDFRFLEERFSVKETNKLISSFVDISSEILKDMGKAVISNLEGGRFVIIFSFGNMRSDLFIYNHVLTAIDRIKTSIKRYLNITACFSIGKIFNNIADISSYYKEAETALKDKFFEGKDKILRKPLKNIVQNELLNLDISDEKNIVTALKTVDRTKLKVYLDTVFSRIIECKASYKSIQMICAELINVINRVAREFGIDVRDVYSDKDIPYNQMEKYETIAEVKQWILGVYEKLLKLMEESRISPDYAHTTRKAMEYIQRNYAKGISLNDTAEYIGVNSSYLSRVFKGDCGKGFVEYLNTVRVVHAKRMIESGDSKLKDITKEIGFNNYSYFFKVFKDIVGMTPQEYEEELKNKQKKDIL